MKALLSLLLFSLICAPVESKDYLAAKIGGDWTGGTAWKIDLTVLILDVEGGDVAADLTVGSPRCSGRITGLGKLEGNVLTLRPFKIEAGEACTIKITFDHGEKKAKVSEEGCSYYHGAECTFEGPVTKNRKP
jgi:hypothetical protein